MRTVEKTNRKYLEYSKNISKEKIKNLPEFKKAKKGDYVNGAIWYDTKGDLLGYTSYYALRKFIKGLPKKYSVGYGKFSNMRFIKDKKGKTILYIYL